MKIKELSIGGREDVIRRDVNNTFSENRDLATLGIADLDDVLLLCELVVVGHTVVQSEAVNVKVIVLGVNHVREGELERSRWADGRGIVENMGAKVNELGESIKVWEVLHVEIPLKRQVVLVSCMDLDIIQSSIRHFWQETCLILRAPGQSLSSNVTELESTALMSSESKHQVTSSSCNSLGGTVERSDVIVIIHVQESVLVIMVQFTSDRSLLGLSQLERVFSGVAL